MVAIVGSYKTAAVGVNLLVMDVNDDAGYLMHCGTLISVTSKISLRGLKTFNLQ